MKLSLSSIRLRSTVHPFRLEDIDARFKIQDSRSWRSWRFIEIYFKSSSVRHRPTRTNYTFFQSFNIYFLPCPCLPSNISIAILIYIFLNAIFINFLFRLQIFSGKLSILSFLIKTTKNLQFVIVNVCVNVYCLSKLESPVKSQSQHKKNLCIFKSWERC